MALTKSNQQTYFNSFFVVRLLSVMLPVSFEREYEYGYGQNLVAMVKGMPSYYSRVLWLDYWMDWLCGRLTVVLAAIDYSTVRHPINISL